FRCPAVVVRRAFYEAYGGFRSDLTFTLDWELWIRAVTLCGGAATSEVLASFRGSANSMTARLAQNAETLQDRLRLAEIFAARYPTFDKKEAYQRISVEAFS